MCRGDSLHCRLALTVCHRSCRPPSEQNLAGEVRKSLPKLRETLTKKIKAMKPEDLLTKGMTSESKALEAEMDLSTPMGRMMAAKHAKAKIG